MDSARFGSVRPQDVGQRAVPGGVLVPSWTVVGDVRDVVELVTGRWPRPGEALVSSEAQRVLGMDLPFGAVARVIHTADDEWAVVGQFRAREPFLDLDRGVVIAGAPGDTSSTFRVVVTHPEAVLVTTASIVGIIAPSRCRPRAGRPAHAGGTEGGGCR